MHICFVIDFYPPHIGGGEIIIQKIVEGLVRMGDECIVITSRVNKGLPFKEEKNRLKIIRIKIPSSMERLWFTLFAIPKIIFYARDCDIIHGASYGGAIPAFIAAKILRKKCIYMVFEFMGKLWNNLESNWFKSQFYQTIEKTIPHLSFDKFVAISRYTRNCLRLSGIPDSKLDFVYCGKNLEILNVRKTPLEIRNELGFSPNDFIYLTYGRTGITKGIGFFVDAIPLIAQRIPNAKFIFILAKSDHKIWHCIMGKLNRLPSEIYRLLPAMPQSELSNYLNASDCIVVPSLSEGFGFTAVEACTLNKRVVATDAGSLPEVIFGEYALVKPGSAQALAEGCYRAFFGETEHSEPKDFSWEKTVNQCREIYRQLLNK